MTERYILRNQRLVPGRNGLFYRNAVNNHATNADLRDNYASYQSPGYSLTNQVLQPAGLPVDEPKPEPILPISPTTTNGGMFNTKTLVVGGAIMVVVFVGGYFLIRALKKK